MSQTALPFSSFRAYFWPVYAHELRKFLPLLLMAFFIGFNYNILRIMKDPLLITAEFSGAVVIPFIKVWGMVPGALLMTFIYSRLNNRIARDKVFYAMISIFLVFFCVFTFLIYPMRDTLHPHETANMLQAMLPPGCKGMIAMCRYWTFSSFYIMSELWSSTVLSMLFWGLANEVTKLGEARRFYGLIAIGLNVATIAAGQISAYLSGPFLSCRFALGGDPWRQTLIYLTTIILISGIIILFIYRYLSKKVRREELAENQPKPEKIRMSMRENFAYLARSRYLLYIAIIVLSYNLVINLVEVIWKDQVSQLYPNPNAYNSYMSQVTTVMGIISFFTSLLISGQILRRFGWTVTAYITPAILLLTSAGFFIFFFGKDSIVGGAVTALGMSPLALVVFFGSAQNCLCRAAKYTVFDATKEMAFIPLSRECKLKGKAAIDGVGSRLGKSGGSMIHQTLLIGFSTIASSAAYVAGILVAAIGFWLLAVNSLGKQFQALTSPAPEPAEEPFAPLVVPEHPAPQELVESKP